MPHYTTPLRLLFSVVTAAVAVAALVAVGITVTATAQGNTGTWSASWSTTAPVEGTSATVHVSNPDVDDISQIRSTLLISGDRSTANPDDLVIRGAQGGVLSPFPAEPSGWGYVNESTTAGDAKNSLFTIEVLDDDDGGEVLAVEVYVDGELATSDVFTLKSFWLDFRDATLSVDEGASVTVSADIHRPSDVDLEIPLTITNHGATTADDYTGVVSTLTIPANSTTGSFTVTAVDDLVDDDDDSFTIAFASPMADCCIAVTTPSVTIGIVDNDDPPDVVISFSAASYSVAESDDADTADVKENEVEVKITADIAALIPLTIPITRANVGTTTDDDYSGVPSEVVLDANTTEVSFAVTATDDEDDDDDEGVQLGFGALPTGVTAGTVSSATISIIDDDSGLVVLLPENIDEIKSMKFPDGKLEIHYAGTEFLVEGASYTDTITSSKLKLILPGAATPTDPASGFLAVTRSSASPFLDFILTPTGEITLDDFSRVYGSEYGANVRVVIMAEFDGKKGRVTFPLKFYYDASPYLPGASRDKDWRFTGGNSIEVYEGIKRFQIPWDAHQPGTRTWAVGNPSEPVRCSEGLNGTVDKDIVLSAWPDAGNEDADGFIILDDDSKSSGKSGPLEVLFTSVADYETPLDFDKDNIYKVRLYNIHSVHGTGKPSCNGSAFDITVIVKDLGPPAPITGIQGTLPTEGGPDVMRISWAHVTHFLDVSSGVEVPIGDRDSSGYEYRYRLTGDGDDAWVTGPNVGYSPTLPPAVLIMNLDEDSYDVQVRGINREGKAPWPVDVLVVQRAGAPPPFEPQFIHSGESPGTTSMLLNWSVPYSETPITGYEIEYKEEENFASTPKTVSINDGAATSYRLTGLKADTLYGLLIRASNEAGFGNPSIYYIIRTQDVSVSIRAVTDTTIEGQRARFAIDVNPASRVEVNLAYRWEGGFGDDKTVELTVVAAEHIFSVDTRITDAVAAGSVTVEIVPDDGYSIGPLSSATVRIHKRAVTDAVTPTPGGMDGGGGGGEPSPTASATPDPAASATPSPVANATPNPAASATPSPVANATPDPAASATPDPAASATPDPAASATPDPAASATPDPAANATPDPAVSATPPPSGSGSGESSPTSPPVVPSAQPPVVPSAQPPVAPSAQPSVVAPSQQPPPVQSSQQPPPVQSSQQPPSGSSAPITGGSESTDTVTLTIEPTLPLLISTSTPVPTPTSEPPPTPTPMPTLTPTPSPTPTSMSASTPEPPPTPTLTPLQTIYEPTPGPVGGVFNPGSWNAPGIFQSVSPGSWGGLQGVGTAARGRVTLVIFLIVCGVAVIAVFAYLMTRRTRDDY